MGSVAIATFIGYLASFTGMISGALMAYRVKKGIGSAALAGAAAGLLIAFICFGALPPVMSRRGLPLGLGILLAGIGFAAFFETHVQEGQTLLLPGIILHHIPEGFALGAMLRSSWTAGLSMAAIIAVHCVPESLFVFTSARATHRLPSRLSLSCLLAASLALGVAPGYVFGGLSEMFVDICLGFSSGLMLTIACGEILPDSASQRITRIAAAAGFAAGVLLTATVR